MNNLRAKESTKITKTAMGLVVAGMALGGCSSAQTQTTAPEQSNSAQPSPNFDANNLPSCDKKAQAKYYTGLSTDKKDAFRSYIKRAESLSSPEKQQIIKNSFNIILNIVSQIAEKYGSDTNIEVNGGLLSQRIAYNASREMIKFDITKTIFDSNNQAGCMSYKISAPPEYLNFNVAGQDPNTIYASDDIFTLHNNIPVDNITLAKSMILTEQLILDLSDPSTQINVPSLQNKSSSAQAYTKLLI